MTLKVLDLFSGIGGFSLGLERTGGFETVAFCEIESFPRKVLAKHWPNVPIHEDVRTLDGKEYRGAVDVVCGGFPCQDLSVAGKKAGFEGERSSLYGEMLRIISDCRPRYAIFENVAGLLTGDDGRWFAKFLYDLAEVGYDAEWHCISASELGAHHHRDRVWILAYPKHDGQTSTKERRVIPAGNDGKQTRQKPAREFTGLSSARVSSNSKKLLGNGSSSNGENSESQTPQLRGDSGENAPDSNMQRCQGVAPFAKLLKQQIQFMRSDTDKRERFDLSEPPLCGTDDGISHWLDGTKRKLQRTERLKGLGNAVVPQIPEIIGRAILEAEGLTNEQN